METRNKSYSFEDLYYKEDQKRINLTQFGSMEIRKHFKPHTLAIQLLKILEGILFYTFDYHEYTSSNVNKNVIYSLFEILLFYLQNSGHNI